MYKNIKNLTHLVSAVCPLLYVMIYIRLDLLMSLVEGGRNIEYLEEEIGPFLLEWFGQVVTADREVDFLHMLVNLIKYNAAYIDEDVLHGFVQ